MTRTIPLLFTGALLLAQAAVAAEPARDQLARRNCVVVTPQGPTDGGDFGPNTPGTKTSGLQEAFDAAKAQVKDLYISGGSWTEGKNQPVVYVLSQTLHIPWMQDFRCDSGHCVIHYAPREGDAVVFDSQMSCNYRLGLIVSMSSGATVRMKPSTAGPDRFKVITSSEFHFNALVGGGGAWPSGEAFNNQIDKKRKWVGTGLLLDASEGPIDANRISVTEVVGCERGIHLTERVTHNTIEATSIHLCQHHLQVGDPGEETVQPHSNRLTVHMESQGIADSTGARLFGSKNRLTLSVEGISPASELVFGPRAEANLVFAAALSGYTNEARRPTSRIVVADGAAFKVATPDVSASGETIQNRHPFAVEVRIVSHGRVARYIETDASGESRRFSGPLSAGQSLVLNPGDKIAFEYDQPPRWSWKAIR